MLHLPCLWPILRCILGPDMVLDRGSVAIMLGYIVKSCYLASFNIYSVPLGHLIWILKFSIFYVVLHKSHGLGHSVLIMDVHPRCEPVHPSKQGVWHFYLSYLRILMRIWQCNYLLNQSISEKADNLSIVDILRKPIA